MPRMVAPRRLRAPPSATTAVVTIDDAFAASASLAVASAEAETNTLFGGLPSSGAAVESAAEACPADAGGSVAAGSDGVAVESAAAVGPDAVASVAAGSESVAIESAAPVGSDDIAGSAGVAAEPAAVGSDGNAMNVDPAGATSGDASELAALTALAESAEE